MLNEDYWKIVARGIDVEDDKAALFVQHNHSRGIAREAILRALMIAHTPDPYIVKTGFIGDQGPSAAPPKQCDVLVYDPRISQPYYRLDEFVVVPARAARVVVEVKSDLDICEFEKLMAMRRHYSRPVLGFAYDGWVFGTFCSNLAKEVHDLTKMPECIAVHRRNYVGIRASEWSNATKNHAFLAVAFPSNTPGLATAWLLSLYMELLTEGRIHDGLLHQSFNNLKLPDEAKLVITPDGTMSHGPAGY